MLMSWLDYQPICICKETFKENFYEIGQNHKQKSERRQQQEIAKFKNFKIKKAFNYN